MRVLPYLKSPTGNLVLFFGFIAVGGLLVFRSNAREKSQAAQMTKVAATEQGAARESITRNGLPFKLPLATLARKGATASDALANDPDDAATATVADAHGQRTPAKATKPRVLPISLFSGITDANAAAPLSKTYAPFGRLIPCETVITIESSKLDTPVIGLVTEDIYHNGELIIPAGTEVHGRASLDRARERIAASGKWVVVWRDGSPLNGTELVLNGIALDREKDDVSGEFGMRDGSAGLLGALIKSDNWQEIKLFASTFLGGFAGGLQQLQNQGTAFGGVAQVPVVSTRNAALAGTADVLNAYARQIQEAIARDGFFVRVPAGKQFYLYVTETIDQAKGTRGNRSNEEIWRKQQ
jgi:hypothetical protein